MSMGWMRYFLTVPSRMSRAMPEASPGMLENARVDHRQQVIGNEVLVAVAGDGGRVVLAQFAAAEDGGPEENLRHHGEELHQRGQGEIGPIDQPLFHGDPQHGPPGCRPGSPIALLSTAKITKEARRETGDFQMQLLAMHHWRFLAFRSSALSSLLRVLASLRLCVRFCSGLCYYRPCVRGLRKHLGDHLFQRRVLDAHVLDHVAGENGGQHLGDRAAGHPQPRLGRLDGKDLAVTPQVFRPPARR